MELGCRQAQRHVLHVSGALTAGTFEHTFNQAGTFQYLCVWHSGMTGTVVVTPAPAAATTAPAAAGAPGAATATPGAASGTPGATPVVAGAAPKLARVRMSGTRLAFSLDNPARLATVAIAGRKTTPVGTVEAKPGRGSMPLALNRLRVGRYTLVVLAKNSAGRSPRLRVPVRVTGGLRSRALLAQRALAAKAAAVAAAATVPVVAASAPPAPASTPAPALAAPAPAATAGTEAAPAPLVCDKAATDHSGHGHGSADRRCDHSGHGS